MFSLNFIDVTSTGKSWRCSFSVFFSRDRIKVLQVFYICIVKQRKIRFTSMSFSLKVNYFSRFQRNPLAEENSHAEK